MHIKIKCPDCEKYFTIDVPLIDRLKSENAILKRRVEQLEHRQQESGSLDYLKDLFGME
jgi:hypothetical protein